MQDIIKELNATSEEQRMKLKNNILAFTISERGAMGARNRLEVCVAIDGNLDYYQASMIDDYNIILELIPQVKDIKLLFGRANNVKDFKVYSMGFGNWLYVNNSISKAFNMSPNTINIKLYQLWKSYVEEAYKNTLC